jgi:hypothetical protein
MQNEEIIEQPSKLSIGLKWGLIGSLAGILLIIIKAVMGQNPFENKFDWSSILGFIIGITAIVLAHKEYKDKGNGFMSFGEGLGIGCIVGLVSSIVTITFTLVYVNLVDQTVMTQLLDTALEDMEKKNQPEQAMEFTKKYFNMFFYGGLIFFTLFFNFILALVISAITKKSNPNPAF